MQQKLIDDQVHLDEMTIRSHSDDPDPDLPVCQFEFECLHRDVKAAVLWIYNNFMADEPYDPVSCKLQMDLDAVIQSPNWPYSLALTRFESWMSKRIRRVIT